MANDKEELIQCERDLHSLLSNSNHGDNDAKLNDILYWVENNAILMATYQPIIGRVKEWLENQYSQCEKSLSQEEHRLNSVLNDVIYDIISVAAPKEECDNNSPLQQTIQGVVDQLQSDQHAFLQVYVQSQPNCNDPASRVLLGKIHEVVNHYNQQRQNLTEIQASLKQLNERLQHLISSPASLPQRLYFTDGVNFHRSQAFCDFQQSIYDNIIDYLKPLIKSVSDYQNQRFFKDQYANYQYLRQRVLPELRCSLADINRQLVNKLAGGIEQQKTIITQISLFYTSIQSSGQAFNSQISLHDLEQFQRYLQRQIDEHQACSITQRLHNTQAKRLYDEFKANHDNLICFIDQYAEDYKEYQRSYYVQWHDYLQNLIAYYTSQEDASQLDSERGPDSPEEVNDIEQLKAKLCRQGYSDKFFHYNEQLGKLIKCFRGAVNNTQISANTIYQVLTANINAYVEGRSKTQSRAIMSKIDLRDALLAHLNGDQDEGKRQSIRGIIDQLPEYYQNILPDNVPRSTREVEEFELPSILKKQCEDNKRFFEVNPVLKKANTKQKLLKDYVNTGQGLKDNSQSYDWFNGPISVYSDKFRGCTLLQEFQQILSDYNDILQEFENLPDFLGGQEPAKGALDIPNDLQQQQSRIVHDDSLSNHNVTQSLKARLLFVTNVRQLLAHLIVQSSYYYQDAVDACREFLLKLGKRSQFSPDLGIDIIKKACRCKVEQIDTLSPLISALVDMLEKTASLSNEQHQKVNKLFARENDLQDNVQQDNPSFSETQYDLLTVFEVPYDAFGLGQVSDDQWRALFNLYSTAVYNASHNLIHYSDYFQDKSACYIQQRFGPIIQSTELGRAQIISLNVWQQRFTTMRAIKKLVNKLAQDNYKASSGFRGRGSYDNLKKYLLPLGFVLYEGFLRDLQAIDKHKSCSLSSKSSLRDSGRAVILQGDLSHLNNSSINSTTSYYPEDESQTHQECLKGADQLEAGNPITTLEEDSKASINQFVNLTQADKQLFLNQFQQNQHEAACAIYTSIVRFINQYMQEHGLQTKQDLLQKMTETTTRVEPFRFILDCGNNWPYQNPFPIPDESNLNFYNLKKAFFEYVSLVENNSAHVSKTESHKFLIEGVAPYFRLNAQCVKLKPFVSSIRSCPLLLPHLLGSDDINIDQADQVRFLPATLDMARGIQFSQKLIRQAITDGYRFFHSLSDELFERIVQNIHERLQANNRLIQHEFLKHCVTNPMSNQNKNNLDLTQEQERFKWLTILKYIDSVKTDLDQEQQKEIEKTNFKESVNKAYADQCKNSQQDDHEAALPTCDLEVQGRGLPRLDLLTQSLIRAKGDYHQYVFCKGKTSGQSYRNVEHIDQVSDLSHFNEIMFARLGYSWRNNSLRTLAFKHLSKGLESAKKQASSQGARLGSFVSTQSDDNQRSQDEYDCMGDAPANDIEVDREKSFDEQQEVPSLYYKYLLFEYRKHKQPYFLLHQMVADNSESSIQQAFVRHLVNCVFGRLLKNEGGWASNEEPIRNKRVQKASQILGSLHQLIRDNQLTHSNIQFVINSLRTITQNQLPDDENNDISAINACETQGLNQLIDSLSYSSSQMKSQSMRMFNATAKDLYDAVRNDNCLSQLGTSLT